MIQKLEMTVLIDNLAEAPLVGEWGLSILIDADGKRYICCHTRFDDGTENHQPLVKQYLLNAEGWPCVLPYAAWGETVCENGYGAERPWAAGM